MTNVDLGSRPHDPPSRHEVGTLLAPAASRGRKPGERRGGRQKGTPNKATAEVKDIARRWGPAAVRTAAELAGLIKGKPAAISEQARVAALNIILDRAYGKAMQPIQGDMPTASRSSWRSCSRGLRRLKGRSAARLRVGLRTGTSSTTEQRYSRSSRNFRYPKGG